MPARRVTHYEKAAMSLEAAAFEFAPQIVNSSSIFWTSVVEEGEPLPQTDEERILALGRWMRRSRQRMVDADDVHDVALRQRHDVVSARDAAAKKLRTTILEVRRNFEGVYGQGKTAKILGLVPQITREGVRLKRYARAAVKQMQLPGYELPAPPSQVASIQGADVVATILPDLETLEGFVERIDEAKRFVQTTLKEKEAAAEDFGRTLLIVARYFEAILVLIGETFFAERVRQSSHVSTGSPEETGGDAAGDAGSGDGPDADGATAADGPATANAVEPPDVGDVEPPAALAANLEASVDEGAAGPSG